jgi:predicted Zn-dependent protease
MRLLLWVLLVVPMAAAPARGEDIVDVLERSQRMRLAALSEADAHSARAQRVRDSFERLVRASGLREPVELRVISGATLAEALLGRVVVANESLGDLPEGERVFILAHELGHVALGHWTQLGEVYKRHIPGAITPATTDPVAGALGRDASVMSHRHELDADAFSVHTLRAMGHSDDDAFSAFRRMGLTRDTPTHPGTRKRMASLRDLQTSPVNTAELAPLGADALVPVGVSVTAPAR